jgi:hypothetical protein
MNDENLIPFNKVSVSRQREIQSMGGKKAQENLRKRKTLREELLLLLQNNDTQQKGCIAILEKFLNGDIKAFETIRDTIGEKPSEKVVGELSVKQALVGFDDGNSQSNDTNEV